MIVLTGIYVLTTIVIGYYNFQSLKLTRKQMEIANLPTITLNFDKYIILKFQDIFSIPSFNSKILNAKIKNIGVGPAKNVTLKLGISNEMIKNFKYARIDKVSKKLIFESVLGNKTLKINEVNPLLVIEEFEFIDRGESENISNLIIENIDNYLRAFTLEYYEKFNFFTVMDPIIIDVLMRWSDIFDNQLDYSCKIKVEISSVIEEREELVLVFKKFDSNLNLGLEKIKIHRFK